MSGRGALALATCLLLATGCASAPPPAPPLPRARLAARAPDARCSACTLPVSDRVFEWPDHRRVCGSCREQAVVDPTEARALLLLARADLQERFGVVFEHAAFDLRLVDLPTLLADAGPDLAHPALQAFSAISPRACEVEALYGLPRLALRGILVHELFHAHQTDAREPGGGPVDLAFIEGAAQYVQLRLLEDLGGHGWAARLVANEDPIYGRGLRRFRRMVMQVGEERALDLGARQARFPPGY